MKKINRDRELAYEDALTVLRPLLSAYKLMQLTKEQKIAMAIEIVNTKFEKLKRRNIRSLRIDTK